MNYKDTIQLPRTSFSMKGNLIRMEPEILEKWENGDIYGRLREARKGSPKFILHDGPPYANGHVHLGTALNKILKDFIVKSYSMMGYDSPYVPGWDCHGMPIEHRVMNDQPEGGADLTREEVRVKCRAYASRYVDVQREEFRRLGVFGAWDRPYLTMSTDYESGIIRAFGKLVESGYVYQGLRPIHWCMKCGTALAEAEVEYGDHSSPSIYVAFPQHDPEDWEERGVPRGVEVVIWTTTPWTLPANMAVALHPGEDYVVVRAGGRNFLVARKRAGVFMEETGMAGEVLPETVFTGERLEGLLLQHPVFHDRNSRMIVAEHVTMEDGTGCVHTAPGHGAEDFMVGREYGLEIFSPVEEDGTFADTAGKYAGMHVFSANRVIVEDLEASGRLLHSSVVAHSYPHCWRCSSPLIFRATRQFFLDLSKDGLKDRVLDRVDEVQWHPGWGYERMKNMMSVRPDWCLSRQRSWGVALPVFTCGDCGSPVLDHEVIAAVADAVSREGSDVWFRLEPVQLFGLAGKEPVCPSCGGSSLQRVDDILDVWFDSSLSHYNVLTEKHGLSRPAAVYLEATDQHRGWFGVSLITSEALGLGRPADNIITHGLIQDRNGRKMSKSLGNVISPLKIIDRQGADILRLWFAGVDYTADFRADLSQLDDAGEAYRKLRNTLRFMLGNLGGMEEFDLDPSRLSGFDRYIYLRFRRLMRFCLDEYGKFQFHRVYRELRNFAVVSLSGQFLDMRKDRLYCGFPDSGESRSTRLVMAWMLKNMVQLLAPLIPFTAEEAWAELPPALRDGEDSVHLSLYPEWDTLSESEDEKLELEAWIPYLDVRKTVLKQLEEKRGAGEIGGGLDAAVDLEVPPGMAGSANGEDWADFLIVSQAYVTEGNGVTVSVRIAEGGKCNRCWRILPEVGTLEPDDVCGRCSGVLKEMGLYD
ncbi:MAG: isoleucine--tRNA ligase [Candidatus Fermentibacteraceae bacterium]|nr:isoleucine--tRNA ligase [Candidatus Fermentibacteraceae bacterium]